MTVSLVCRRSKEICLDVRYASVGVFNIPAKYQINSIRAAFEFREVRLSILQPA